MGSLEKAVTPAGGGHVTSGVSQAIDLRTLQGVADGVRRRWRPSQPSRPAARAQAPAARAKAGPSALLVIGPGYVTPRGGIWLPPAAVIVPCLKQNDEPLS